MRRAAWALSLTLMVGVAESAFAQGAATTSNAQAVDAKEAFRRGEAAYSAGNYDVAIREWDNAYKVDPRPRIQFNLSQAYERLGQMENAIRALETFLDSGDPDDPTYSDANARLVALRQRLEATGVVVKGGAEGGLILVDDRDWGRTPRPDKITVAPGNHVVLVKWPDGNEFRTSIYVPAGQSVEVVVAGNGAPNKPVASAAGQAPAEAPTDRRALWYGLGGGSAAAGVALLVAGGVRKSATGDCGGTSPGEFYCEPDSEDKANKQALGAFVGGGVLVAAGAAFFIVGAVTHKKSDSQTKTAKSQCGIGLASAACRFQF